MIGRRGFLSKLFGAGVSLSTLQSLAPGADITEMRDGQRFLLHFRNRLSRAELLGIADTLNGSGVKGVVCDSSVEISKL
jgi:hypothetical protein